MSSAAVTVGAARRGSAPSRRLALVVALALVFAALVIQESATRLTDSEDGWRAVGTAKAIADGRARWGLTDYTHHPMGPSYALLPVLWVGRPDLIPSVPAWAGALATAAAFAVLLFIAPAPLWPGVIAAFTVLLWQPGYLDWLHTTWQHSWNLSIVFVLIALGCGVARAAPWLMLVGYVAGWIGYDFVFVQVATVVAVRLAFWSQVAPWRMLLAAGDEALAFAAGMALAFLSHLVQNALYFSSGVLAVQDLLGGISIRMNNSNVDVPTLQTRWTLLLQLAGDYVRLFFAPKWSHWPSLAAAGVVVITGVALAWWRIGSARRVALPLAAIAATAVGGLLAWWGLAPGHAAPHLHFFPRMLLVPLYAALAGAVRVLSIVPPPAVIRWRPSWRHALAVAVTLALLPPVLRWAGTRLDDRIYTHAWATTDAAPRSDRIGAPFLNATSAQAAQPAILKSGYPLVGGVNTWAQYLDDTAWRPGGGPPWVYEERFARRAAVSSILLRFPGPARGRGALLAFTIELLGAPTPTALDEATPGVRITEIGFLRGFHYRLDPAVIADGLRLTIRRAEHAPILNDLLAFGHPVAN